MALLQLFENDQGSTGMQCVGDGRSRYLFHASVTYSQNLMCDNYYNEDVMRRTRKDTCTWKNVCEKMKYAQPGK